jgi:hypothetical protein
MFVENSGTLILSPEHRKRKKRQSSFYFSSSKALLRSRMTRGKGVVSKTGQSTLGDLRKVLHFGIRGSGEDEDATVHNTDAVQETSNDTSGAQIGGREVYVGNVRI